MNLFRLGSFMLNSGKQAPYKIDCDALTHEDWQCLAYMVAKMVGSFSAVEGVPSGGLCLAAALEPYILPGVNRLLIVDDVLTTGASMERQRAGRLAQGAVVFARGPYRGPADVGGNGWIKPLFSVPGALWL